MLPDCRSHVYLVLTKQVDMRMLPHHRPYHRQNDLTVYKQVDMRMLPHDRSYRHHNSMDDEEVTFS